MSLSEEHRKKNVSSMEDVEIDYWRSSPTERPESESIENLINKFGDAGILLDRISHHRELFERSHAILELGAGQAWASCIVKKLFPSTCVIATDISEYAVASAPKWEHVLRVKLDHRAACRSYELPFASQSVDLIFAFQAAHHFRAHRRTLSEVARVLTPGGACLYLHEPTCRAFIHPLAHRRVNHARPHVPEDVLIFKQLMLLGEEAGLQASYVHNLTLTRRGPVELLYYLALRRVGVLTQFLPTTKDLCFIKPTR